ncbi:MAG TPA: SDR family NAD(P)-dependent oxidoreductase, partial [Saprospiraceae bacterium]|nr:SDR family NAD(P)-dependent oxidoreductase [Saprospiraceae bacterium]
MDLQIKDKLYVVTGGTSGFGLAIAKRLVEEGAYVIINARGKERLEELKNVAPHQIEVIEGDITTDAVIADVFRKIDTRPLAGVVLNAAGPPAKSFLETNLRDWDTSYESILRWK